MRSLPRVLAGLGLLLLAAAESWGHDSGFGHCRRTLLFSAKPDEVLLEYRIVLSPEEALVEMTQMDRDGDGRVSAEEKNRYFALRARELARGWTLSTAEGERLEPVFARVELGHSLTQSYRFSVSTLERTIFFVDTNFSHKPGQVSILSGPGLQAEPQKGANLAHAERISLVITRTGK
jgi:hypothetical protein